MGNNSFNLQSTIQLLQTKWKQLLLFMFVSLLVAAVTIMLVKKQYRSSALIVSANPSLADKSHLLNQNIQNLYSLFGSGDDLERIYAIASMDTVYKQLVDEFNLVVYYDMKGDDRNLLRYKAVLEFKENLTIQKTDLGQLKISLWTNEPSLSAKIINRLIEITRNKEEAIWKEGYEKMYVNFHKSIDSLTKLYTELSTKTNSDKSLNSQLTTNKLNYLLEQINRQEKAAAEIKLSIENNTPSLYVLESAVPASKSEKPNIPELLIITALVSLVFGTLVLLIYHREESI